MKKLFISSMFLLALYSLKAQQYDYTIDLSDTGMSFSGRTLIVNDGNYYNTLPSVTSATISDAVLKSVVKSRLDIAGVTGVTVEHAAPRFIAFRFLALNTYSKCISKRLNFRGTDGRVESMIQLGAGTMYLDTQLSSMSVEVSSAGNDELILSFYGNTSSNISSALTSELNKQNIDWITVDKIIDNTSIALKISPNALSYEFRKFYIYGNNNSSYVINQHLDAVYELLDSGIKSVYPWENTPVELSGSRIGISYSLIRTHDDVSTTVQTISGTSRPLQFDPISSVGIYHIETNAGDRMNGTIQIVCDPIYAEKQLTVGNKEILLDKNGCIYNVGCIPVGSVNLQNLQNIIDAYNTGQVAFWDPAIQINFDRIAGGIYYFKLICAPNPSNVPIENNYNFIFHYADKVPVKIKQPGGGSFLTYNVAGRYDDASNQTITVSLSGSQLGVMYRLERNGIFVTEIPGTGNPIHFENLTQNGTYHVSGNAGSIKIFMNGSAVKESPQEVGNWIKTTTYLDSLGQGANVDITYFNGLGLEEQTVNVGASPHNGHNIVTTVHYDKFLRKDSRHYLPYVSEFNSELMENEPLRWQSLYYEEQYGEADARFAFTETVFEASPLSRPLKSYRQGSVYRDHIDPKYSSTSYGIYTEDYSNTMNPVLDLAYDSSAGVLNIYRPEESSSEVKKYFTETVTDEDGNVTVAYKNVRGNTILQRLENRSDDTYYVYDDLNRLCYVMPPNMASVVDSLGEYSVADDDSLSRNYAYIYRYDDRGRCIMKRLPGADWIYTVYDQADRPVLIQDGNMRGSGGVAGKWIYSVYDEFHRPVGQYFVSSDMLREDIQVRYNAADFENTYPILGGATDKRKPFADDSFTYIATISEHRFGGYVYPRNIANPELTFQPVAEIVSAEDLDSGNTGMLIFERQAVIDTTANDDNFVERSFYYDYKGRVIQTVERNHLGGVSRYSSKYDFVGNLLVSHESHQTSASSVADVKMTRFTYDKRGYLLSEVSSLNEGTEGEVAYTYDGLGQLANKVYGSDSIAVESNSYNIQGWLTHRSNDLFEMKLRYYNPLKGTLPSYTGNIAEWEWLHKGISAENTINTYAFTYDGRGMLKDTEHYTGSSTVPDGLFTERGIVYDSHGNILKLKRHGASAQLIDDFTYGYSGNQLISLKTADNPGGYSYGYDTNGNMTFDGHNALNLNYNYLNLTSTVADTTDNILASYRWLADGTKAGVKNAAGTAGYEYIGSLVYQRNALDELSLESGSFGGGRFSVSESGSGRVYTPNYYLTDHLGSTRAIVNALGAVAERSDYFPFGLAWANAQASTNRYLFNGKELQVAGFPDGSNYLDYGARIYLPRLGRFTASDPLSEIFYGHTTYNFTLNNPVNLIDLYGLAPIRVPGGSFDFDTLLGSIDAVSCYGGSGGLSTFDRMLFRGMQDHVDRADGHLRNSDEAILARIYALNPMARVVHNAHNTFIENPVTQTVLGITLFVATGGIEGFVGLASLGRTLFAKTAARMSIKVGVRGTNAFRYMTEGELKAIQQTGFLRGGLPGETFFTKDLYKSAAHAQKRLALPSKPTLRVEYQILNNPTLMKNGTKVLPANGMVGKGAEFMTLDPVQVKLINWQLLN